MVPSDPSYHEDELDLPTYLDILRPRWTVKAVVVVLAVAMVLGLALRQESQYRLQAEVLIRQTTAPVPTSR